MFTVESGVKNFTPQGIPYNDSLLMNESSLLTLNSSVKSNNQDVIVANHLTTTQLYTKNTEEAAILFSVGSMMVIFSSLGMLFYALAHKKLSEPSTYEKVLVVKPVYTSLCYSDFLALLSYLLLGIYTAYQGHAFSAIWLAYLSAMLVLSLKSLACHVFIESVYHVTKRLHFTLVHQFLFYGNTIRAVLCFIWSYLFVTSIPLLIIPGCLMFNTKNYSFSVVNNRNVATFLIVDFFGLCSVLTTVSFLLYLITIIHGRKGATVDQQMVTVTINQEKQVEFTYKDSPATFYKMTSVKFNCGICLIFLVFLFLMCYSSFLPHYNGIWLNILVLCLGLFLNCSHAIVLLLL